MEQRVLNKRTLSKADEEGTVYVGRPSQWGNPFVIGRDGDRGQVIERYRLEVLPYVDLQPLVGRHLVCWCSPLPCHADVLLAEVSRREAGL
jgi:hypothetical protein